jgi:hypothetical protein
MTATYGAVTKVAYGSRANTVINVPASSTDGKMLILLQANANSGTAVSATMPAGWTAFGAALSGTDGGGFGWRMQMAWRIASSEPASYTITHATTGLEAIMLRIDGTGTLSIDASSMNSAAGPGVTSTALSVTTTAADDLLIYFGLNWQATALTPPTGMTEVQDSSITYFATQALSASGATGDRTQTHAFDPWFANLVAVKDTAGGGGGGGGKPVKVWSGSAWVTKPVKVWSGSAWVTKPAKVWNGSAWV